VTPAQTARYRTAVADCVGDDLRAELIRALVMLDVAGDFRAMSTLDLVSRLSWRAQQAVDREEAAMLAVDGSEKARQAARSIRRQVLTAAGERRLGRGVVFSAARGVESLTRAEALAEIALELIERDGDAARDVMIAQAASAYDEARAALDARQVRR